MGVVSDSMRLELNRAAPEQCANTAEGLTPVQIIPERRLTAS